MHVVTTATTMPRTSIPVNVPATTPIMTASAPPLLVLMPDVGGGDGVAEASPPSGLGVGNSAVIEQQSCDGDGVRIGCSGVAVGLSGEDGKLDEATGVGFELDETVAAVVVVESGSGDGFGCGVSERRYPVL